MFATFVFITLGCVSFATLGQATTGYCAKEDIVETPWNVKDYFLGGKKVSETIIRFPAMDPDNKVTCSYDPVQDGSGDTIVWKQDGQPEMYFKETTESPNRFVIYSDSGLTTSVANATVIRVDGKDTPYGYEVFVVCYKDATKKDYWGFAIMTDCVDVDKVIEYLKTDTIFPRFKDYYGYTNETKWIADIKSCIKGC